MRTNKIYKIKLFLVLVLIVLMPQIVLAQTPNGGELLQKDITRIDIELNDKVIQRENLLKELNKISDFSAVARSWFSKISQKNAEIKRLEATANNKYENNPVNVEIRKQKKELESLNKLDGNTIVSYSNKSCKTVKHLLNEFHSAADKSKNINQELAKLNKEINKQLDEHDTKSNYLDVVQGDIEDHKKNIRNEIKFYEEEYDYLYNLAHNQNSWILMDPILGEPIIVDKGLFLRYISQEYLKDIRISAEYDQAQFATYLKKRQNDAYEQTKAMQYDIKNRLPKLQQKIDTLKKKLDTLKVAIAKLEGCWLLTTGRSTSTIDVYLDEDNFYHGILIKNKLKHYRDGSEIFKVKRQTHDTFKGDENSFNKDGYPRKNNLTIKVHRNGNFLTYTSDASTTMNRCQQ